MIDEIQRIINILENRIKEMFKDDKSGHNIDHLQRTLNLALYLQSKEGGNKKVIAVSSFLHDIHRIIKTKNGGFVKPVESLPIVRMLIADLPLTQKEKDHVCYAIEHHEEYSFGGGEVTISDIESKILQDADNIDAAGAIGIVRTISYSIAHDRSIYNPDVPLVEGEYFEGSNADASALHHCVNKLARLHKTMNTKTGKVICKKRCKFIKQFVDEYIKEYNGKA